MAEPGKKIALVTLFPEMFDALSQYGISARAVKQGLVELAYFNPRDFTHDRHQTVDDRPYGGGPGMVMKVQPLKDALAEARRWVVAKSENENAEQNSAQNIQPRVIYLSPQGQQLQQAAVENLAQPGNLIFIAGRYEGIDERFIQSLVDEEWSIGDYVLSGGELPAMVLMDALIRLLPGALGHELSAEQDSFSEGLLDCPHYTRPETFEGQAVPDVLLSGDHGKIRRWRLKQALGRTWRRRPDLLSKKTLTTEQQTLLEEYRRDIEH